MESVWFCIFRGLGLYWYPGLFLHYPHDKTRPAGPSYPLQEPPSTGSAPFRSEFPASHHIPLEHVAKPGNTALVEMAPVPLQVTGSGERNRGDAHSKLSLPSQMEFLAEGRALDETQERARDKRLSVG